MSKFPKSNKYNRNTSQRSRGPREDRGKNAWNPLAEWYSGWVGSEGSKYHQTLAFPHTLKLLSIKDGDKILDIGCGTGVFAKSVHQKGGRYYGIDISHKMIAEAKKESISHGKFSELDILKMQPRGDFTSESFDGVTFILSLQDIPDYKIAIDNACRILKSGGKLVMFIKHPAFNIPRQSGWIDDTKRKLTSRRVDNYLTPLDMPLVKKLGKKTITTFHYHRPIEAYINALIENKMQIFSFEEVLDEVSKDKRTKEFPMFLAIGAKKA